MNNSKMNEAGNFTGLEIAVIGMAGRFPGANNVDAFWENLENGIESVRYYSGEELLESGVDKDLTDHPGYVKTGRYIEGKEYFDANFFGYLPAEAGIMDPQVRIFHECVWEALEDAGYDPDAYEGLIGLYAGAGVGFYWQVYSAFMSGHSDSAIDPFAADQFRNRDFIATLVSYRLNLKGPAVFIHTACSTSLVAIHNACRGLLTGESHIALAGGVSLNHASSVGYLYREGMVLSSDGHCRAFDAEAKGTVGGEGAAVVVLKRLKKAAADRDNIVAIVKGSAINNDGVRKIGYSAPSEDGQADAIQMAHKMARVEPQSITYIEAHGTGTILGDPIEMAALTQVFGKSKEKYCAVGSVKTNIGHVDTAAGAAGFIKTVLALKHRRIPPSLHFKSPNPRIDFENSPFYVNTELREWKNNKYPLRAGVSSFGIGGTNAHVVLEEAPPPGPSSPGREYQLLLFSAKTVPARERMRENLKEYLKKNLAHPVNPGLNLADAAYTLQVGRQPFLHRGMMVCRDMHEAIDILSIGGADRFMRFTMGKDRPDIVFMFSGQGSQYVNMGLGLYQSEPVFRSEMDRCFEILKTIAGRDMKQVLYPDEGEFEAAKEKLDQFVYTSPIKFVFDYCLAVLLMKWGLQPDAMIGHSFGEYTAACLSGVFSLEDALYLSVKRGELLEQMTVGAMLGVPLSEEELKPLLAAAGDLSLAAVNGESLCLAAGTVEAVNRLEARLNEQGHECLRLNVSRAGHSWMMEEITEEFRQKLGRVTFNKPQIPYISGLTGTWITAEDAVDPGYWKRHLRQTIRFADGLTTLMKMKETNPIFLQIGPDRGLPLFVNRHPGKQPGTLALNLVRHHKEKVPDIYHLLEQLGLLWLHGVSTDWKLFYAGEKRGRVSLPAYPFEKIKYPVKADLSNLAAKIGTGRVSIDEPHAYPSPHSQKPMDDWEWRQGQEAEVERPSLSTGYREPSTPTEYALVEIWKNFFSIGKIGIDDDFYELGGDSLKGMSLCNMIHKKLDVRVPLAEFFTVSTIGELAAHIDASQKEAFAAVEKAEEKEYYILSSAQKRLYFIQRMLPGSTAYNVPLTVPLQEGPDREQLERVFRQLINRHESFRTSFQVIEGEAVQRIHEDVEFGVEYFDLDTTDREEIAANFIRPFDLSKAPLLRAGLAAGISGGTPILMVDMHHIIADASSLNIVEKDFKALASGEQPPGLPLQYKDYTEWQNSKKQKKAVKNQENYWLKTFGGELPILQLPFDYPRPAVQRFEGSTVNFFIGKEKTKRIKEMAASFETTLFTWLLAAYNILLSRLSGQEDIVVGVPVEGRAYLELKHTVGMFVNTLPIRNYPSQAKDFTGFLHEVGRTAAAAFENQDYPFENLVEKIDVKRDTGRNPIFDVALNLVSLWEFSGDLPGTEADRDYDHQPGNSKFDLTFTFIEVGGGLSFSTEYCTKLFKPATIERFIGYFKKIVSRLLENPKLRLSGIDILGKEEKQQLLIDFNQTRAEYPEEKTITALFAVQVERVPDNTALVFGDQLLTYREVDRRSNRLAVLLRQKGVSPGDIVGLKVNRSIEMLIMIWGILKAGGAYLPIDTDYPRERIDFMLKDSNARILLSGVSELSEVSKGTEVIDLHSLIVENEDSGPTHLTHLTHLTHSTHLCYVIYTSGTTGWPRGVVITHGNVIPVVKNTNYIQLDKTDRVLQLSNYAFDGSVFDIFGALLNGAALVLIETGILLDVRRLSEFIKVRNITVFFVTTALFNTLVTLNINCFAGVRKVLFGGERVSVLHVARAFNHLGMNRILHMYGPTETTVYATCYFVDALDKGQETIPIGKPLSNTTVYILDRELNPVPIGVAGEMVIGGPGVAPGYLNHPELTAERFIDYRSNKSYRSYSSSKIYKTGDLARWLADGNIEFIGRIDLQVKIRGFRIEPGEIEKQLLEIEEITEALVIPGEIENGERYLCAYIVIAKEIDISEVRDRLSFNIPDYMIPSYFMPIEKIPLTPNGKVDRKRLPVPEIVPGSDYAAPRGKVEKKMAAMWSDVLGIEKEKIGVTADFFELGGHSLKAATLAARIHQVFNTDLPLKVIFRTPTVRGLAEYIAGTSGLAFISIPPVEKKEYYGLSSTQRRLFVIQQMETENVVYNVPLAVVLEGELDKKHLEGTIGKLIKRHESLRTSFVMINQEPVQRVHEDIEFVVDYFILAAKNAKCREEIITDFIRSFDLSKAPLLRVGLLRVDKREHVLILDMHHIITDGSSQAILLKEFMDLYAGKELKPLRIQYRDYARWQKEQKENLEDQEEYWLNLFAADAPVLNLSTDYPRPAVQSFAGSTFQFTVDRENTGQLREAAANHGATLYMVLLAIFNVLLAKLSGQEDIVIGTPIAGRRHAELEHIIGMFVNTLALKNSPSPGKTFDYFLTEVKKQTLDAFDNQEYQFEDLVEQFPVSRDVGRNPLFDVMFVLQNVENPPVEIPGLTLRPYVYETNISKFDLTLSGLEAEEKLFFVFEYCTKLFKKETIERFISYFKKIVFAVGESPGVTLGEIEVISKEEKNLLLFEFNQTESGYPTDKTIHELFAEQVEKRPDGAAVIGHGGIHITYRELNQKANRVAHSLREKGVPGDSIIGIKMERSLEMIIGILGILKAGGAYLPIDPESPQERIDYMLKDSNARVLVSELSEESKVSEGTEVVKISEVSKLLSTHLTHPTHPTQLCYIIYTSGTTGRPKGTAVQHRSLVNLCYWHNNYYEVTEKDNATQYANTCFDASVWEIFPYLIKGAALHIINEDIKLDIQRLGAYYRERHITISFLPTQLCQQFMEEIKEIPSLRCLLAGGDKLNRFFERGYRLYNNYGPTENTVVATSCLVEAHKENIPIGKPIGNNRIYILNKDNLRLQPFGAAGELCIAGDSLARGYLNRPELTAEKFVSAPASSSSSSSSWGLRLAACGCRLYKTGDLARWLADGSIEFLGRIDHQVKVRGFRIESGEIENRLREIEEITEAVVIPREVEKGEKYLCAYIVAGEEIEIPGLRLRLSTCLPDYMVPSFFIKIEKIPLTPNGKVDRGRLPVPEDVLSADYVGPRQEIEERLVDIWANVLKIKKEKIGITADFFELGGHSLKAVVISSRIHRELDVKLPLTEIFKRPTIKGLAEYIRKTGTERFVSIEPVEEKGYYALSPAQKRLFILQHMQRDNLSYNMPAVVLLEGTFAKERLEKAIRGLIHRHENLRTSFEMMEQQPIQRIHRDIDFAVGYYERSEEEARELIDTFVKPFDLSEVPLLRVRVVKIGETGHLLMVDMHHIISDGTSMGIFIREFTALYEGKEPPPLRIQYKDFSRWQNIRDRIEAIKKQEEYWLGEFKENVPVLNLPIDYERPAVQSGEGNFIAFELDTRETMLLKEMALEEGVTLYMMLLAIFNLLLSKECDQEDIIIGAPTAGRRHADLEPLIGFFINMLALRNFPNDRKTFREFLLEIKQRTLDAYENQDYQFEELVEKVLKDRGTGRNSLIDVVFVFQNLVIMAGQIPEVTIPGLTLKPYEQDVAFTPFDLILNGYEAGEKLAFFFQYRTTLFKEETIRMLIRNFKEVVSTVTNNKNMRLKDIEISHDLMTVQSASLHEEEGDFQF